MQEQAVTYNFNTFMPFMVNQLVPTVKELKDMKISKGW
jgi:hypothetical protein